MSPSQERVLDLLRYRADRGVTQVDFLAPGVADGGPPITRLAARILELREQGYGIVKGGRRQSCSIYILTSSPDPAPSAEPVAAARLFDPPASRPRGAYDEAA